MLCVLRLWFGRTLRAIHVSMLWSYLVCFAYSLVVPCVLRLCFGRTLCASSMPWSYLACSMSIIIMLCLRLVSMQTSGAPRHGLGLAPSPVAELCLNKPTNVNGIIYTV